MADDVISHSRAFLSRRETWRMFDRIVGCYDFLNRVLSLRRDVAWRRQVARMLPDGEELRILDLATGTGDMLLAILDERPRARPVVGLDMAGKMLSRCMEKLRSRQTAGSVHVIRGDAASIALRSGIFDAVTMGFGIRNMEDIVGVLREARRVLKPGGRLLILEFSMPRRPVRWVHLFYLRHVMPRIAGYVSGDSAAYEYLDRTIESFPCGEAFCQLMRDAGFRNARAMPRTFGIATIYQGERQVGMT